MHLFASYPAYNEALKTISAEIAKKEKIAPFVIPVGGTTTLGAVGFVNAGFELAQQVADGTLAAPSTIVVPFGSMGTAIGLAIGIRAAGLSATRVVGVQVVPDAVGSEARARALWAEVGAYLRRCDSSFPEVEWSSNLAIERGYFGEGYGIPTPKALAAIDRMRETVGLSFEGTYSGKACAAFIDLAEKNVEKGPLLFWHTYNSSPLPAEALEADFHKLPPAFHQYFR
jgi:D-cysteine desulfhydrase